MRSVSVRTHTGTGRTCNRGRRVWTRLLLPAAIAILIVCGQSAVAEANRPLSATTSHSAASFGSAPSLQSDMDNCRVHRVTDLPGSHQFASEFIETIAGDPARNTRDRNVIWGLTADLSSAVPLRNQALYIARSSNGGATWTEVARIDARYFNARIGEGLRNGLIVAPGGAYFVLTTQRGAFQVFPRANPEQPLVRRIAGPRVPNTPPRIAIPKKPGEPVRANVVGMTLDGKHLIIGYGYFDLDPQLFEYRQEKSGVWVEAGPLPPIPTEMDLLSMRFENPEARNPKFLVVGTGDQAYRLDLDRRQWTRVEGVGPDSAIHAMDVVGGLHLAACWGVYKPVSPGVVQRVTDASFLLHPGSDASGPNLRVYGIEVDPFRPNREVVTSITGVYISRDSGATWHRLNDLPEEEFRSSHFNPDGTLLVSGITGTYLVNPYSSACAPHLTVRGQ